MTGCGGYRGEVTFRRRVRRVLAPIPGALNVARVAVETVTISMRYRVTGLAAEAAFFALLSVPPLVLALIAGVGFLGRQLGTDVIATVTEAIETWALRFLTENTVDEVIMPTVSDTLVGGRADLLSIGFLLSLWAGSRALHVFMDTIVIMYGQMGYRGIVRSRALSLSLYVASIVTMGITVPLVLIGPGYLRSWLPEQLEVLVAGYWPTVAVLGLVGLTGLYHFSTPGALTVLPRHRGSGPGGRHLGGGLQRAALLGRAGRRGSVRLRAAVHPHHPAGLALLPGDRRAGRGRVQRRAAAAVASAGLPRPGLPPQRVVGPAA